MNLAKLAFQTELSLVVQRGDTRELHPKVIARMAADLGMTYGPTRRAVTAELLDIPLSCLSTYYELKAEEIIALRRLFYYDEQSPEIKELQDRYLELDPQVRQEATARRQEAKDARATRRATDQWSRKSSHESRNGNDQTHLSDLSTESSD